MKLRKFDIIVNGKTFINPSTGLQFRVVFDTKTNYTENLNFFNLSIYNLSRDTKIEQGSDIIFSAGYRDEYDVIFSGKVITSYVTTEGVNKITKLFCRSQSIQRRNTICQSFGRGTTIIQLLNACASAWGLSLKVDQSQFAGAQVFTNGYVLNGDIPTCMNNLATMFDFGWAEVNQFLIVDRNGKPVKGQPREISQFTGMIGLPRSEGDINGIFVEVDVRLSPKIRVGTNVRIKSEYASLSTGNMNIEPPKHGGNLSGKYKVISVVHAGDSSGSSWRTSLKCQKVS